MKKLIIASLVLILSMSLLAGCSQAVSKTQTETDKKEKITITIGIQQILGPLMIAKNKGWFEEEFAKKGVKVQWSEFQSGPPHFEAMASGRLDFGQVGNSPVLGAQAADIPFKEIANISEGLKGNAILVQKNSSIKTIKDLKGKKVAVAKGSSGFDLLYQAIDKAGLEPKDVQIIQLQPDEAQPAFETGTVDAWAIWDPFISLQETKNRARVLANCETLNIVSPSFTIVREEFAEEHPELVVEFLRIYEKALQWQYDNHDEAVQILAKEKKISPEIVEKVLENTLSLNAPIKEKIVKSQQKTADFQYSMGAIKQKINTTKVVDNSYIKKALKEK